MALTAKEEKFCVEYIKCLNKTKAAIKAGYSIKTARQIGCTLFTKVNIKQRIEALREEIKLEKGIDEHNILTKLMALADWNIKDFVGDGNKIKDLKSLSRDKLEPVVGIRVKETITQLGEVTTREVTTELKMADKRATLIDLGRYLGVFEKDNQQKVQKIIVKRK